MRRDNYGSEGPVMIQSKLALFVSNAQVIKREFKWQIAPSKRMTAFLCAQNGKMADCRKLRECYDLIRKNAGLFSRFRGNIGLYAAAVLSLSPDPQKLIKEALKVYDLMRDARFRTSDFLVVTALVIAERSAGADHANVIARTKAFYDRMRSNLFFRTGPDDYIFAAMLALTDLDVTYGTDKIKWLYDRLKDEFRWSKNSVHTLAQILVMGSSDDDTADRVLSIRDAFIKKRIKLHKTYTLPSLGVLSLLPAETDKIVRDVSNAMRYLRAQKGFGRLSVSMPELLLYAVAGVANEYAQNLKDGILTATLSTAIANIILAQQMAMIAAVSGSAAAAAAGSS